MVVRKLLDLMFSQHDLAWLDDILPDKDKKKKEDDKKKKKDKKSVEPESDEEVRKRSCYGSVFSDKPTLTLMSKTVSAFFWKLKSRASLHLCVASGFVFFWLILYVSPLFPTVLLKRHCITLTTVFLSVHPNLRGFILFHTFLHRRNSPFAYLGPFCLCFDIEEADGTLHLVTVNVAHSWSGMSLKGLLKSLKSHLKKS